MSRKRATLNMLIAIGFAVAHSFFGWELGRMIWLGAILLAFLYSLGFSFWVIIQITKELLALQKQKK